MKAGQVLILLAIVALCGFLFGRLSIEVAPHNATPTENLPSASKKPELRKAAEQEEARDKAAIQTRKDLTENLLPQPPAPTRRAAVAASGERGEATAGLAWAAYKGATDPKVVIIESSDFQ